jgi:hypothetical protein
MPKVSLALEAFGRRYCNSRHMLEADRFSIKYFQVVNVCNDFVIVPSLQTRVVWKVVRTMFTNFLTNPINKPLGSS